MSRAVLLVSHGTVDNLDDLAEFVSNVRRGRPPTAELVAELRRRYEAIGGRSPLNETSAALAQKLGAVVGVRVAWANRLWRPYVRDVLAQLAREGTTRIAVVPLAPFSAHVYERDAKSAAEGLGVELACAAAWGQSAKLVDAFAARMAEALGSLPEPAQAMVIMTAHSLPQSVIAAGDPYERDIRAAAAAIAAQLHRLHWRAGRGPMPPWTLAFQSQGLGGPGVQWLGPGLNQALDDAQSRGARGVVFAPIGFLADHVETLYDLDIEASALARQRELAFARARTFDADDDFVEILADLARPLLS
jgi:ferrochelatase